MKKNPKKFWKIFLVNIFKSLFFYNFYFSAEHPWFTGISEERLILDTIYKFIWLYIIKSKKYTLFEKKFNHSRKLYKIWLLDFKKNVLVIEFFLHPEACLLIPCPYLNM